MVSPGLEPPKGVVSDFTITTSSVKTAALAVDVVGIVLTTTLFAMRMTARYLVSGRYQLDDVCCIIAYLGFMGYCTISLIMLRHGGGINQWDVPETEVIPFTQSVYATMVCYGPAVFATKASILFFLTRVFQPFERYCRFVYIFTALMGCYYTLMLFLKIFICRPISLFWAPGGEGQCFNQRALILADNIISLISDIAVLLIPCPLAGGLKVALSAKLRIAAVFGAGGLACVCTFMRLIDIIRIGGSTNATYSFTLINLWGIAEVGIGLICACFPVLPAFWKYLHKQHPSQLSGSYPRSGTGGGHSHHRRMTGKGTGSNGGIELSKKSHHSRIEPPRYSVGGGGGGGGGFDSKAGVAHMYDNGSDENMLIPPGEGMVTVSVRGGGGEQDLEWGKVEGVGTTTTAVGDTTAVGTADGEEGYAVGNTKRSYEDQGIVRTVEVQMMREPK